MDDLIARAKAGDKTALAELFDKHRQRLRTMIDLRLDGRLRGRVDPSDVLQEAYIDLAHRLQSYSEKEDLPFYLWLRLVTVERLLKVHRHHFDAQKRDVRQELNLHRRSVPHTASFQLAAHLVGRFSSVAQKAIRTEMQLKLQEVLNDMDEIDREIIVLRNFEEMTNQEAALALEISPKAASNRFIRAIRRLRKELAEIPGFLD